MGNTFSPVQAELDIQIGSVEVKDHTTDNRAHVTAANELKIIGNITPSHLVVDDTTVLTPTTDSLTPIAMANTADAIDAGDYGVPLITIERHQVVGIFDAAGNRMPTMDVVGRAGYTYVTDGTNTMPTMDNQARPGFMTITDGATEVDIIAGGVNSIKSDLSSVAGTVTVTGGVAGLQAIAGNIAHDGIDAGNPVKVGGIYSAPFPADVASGDRTDIQTDAKGRLELANFNRLTGAAAVEQTNEHSVSVSGVITFLSAVVADTTSSVFDNQMFYRFGHIHATVTTANVNATGDLYIEGSVDGNAWGILDSWNVPPGAATTYEQPFAIEAPYNKIRIRWDEVVDGTTCTVKGIFRGA